MGSGCALLESPPQPIVPTFSPPPTVEGNAVDFEAMVSGTPEAVRSALTVDPDTAALLNNVSRQNLFAYVRRLESFGTRHTLSTSTEEDFGIGAARRWIFDEFNRVGGGRLEVAMHEFPLNYGGTTTNQQNVVATLPGNGEYGGTLIVMAHYDSRGADVADAQSPAPGANDNASGVAVLLEAARLLSTRQWPQTIIFVAFAAEEQGTFGSKEYVQDVMLDGMVIEAAINNDIIGGRSGIPQSVRVFAPGPENSRHIQLARYMDVMADLYSPMFSVNIQQAPDREGRFGDHREFLAVGVPAVRLTESLEDFSAQHNDEDTANKIDYEYLVQVARLNVAALANLAGSPPVPSQPTVAAMADPGSYLLTWASDERAAGYAVFARPVGSYEAEVRYVSAVQAGNVGITGFDPGVTYNVSLAAVDAQGRISFFSPETLVGVATQEGGAPDGSDAITETNEG